MSKMDMAAALRCEGGARAPLWELKYHLWGRASGAHFTYKTEYMRLSTQEQQRALAQNAQIIAQEARTLHMSAVTIPSPPWQTEYELPMEHRPRLIRMLRDLMPDVMVVASCGGVIGMPDAAVYADFCYQMYDEPEAIDAECERLLRRSMDKMQPLLDAGAEALYTPSDIADNHGPFFRPEFLHRWVLPYLDKWAEAVHAGGGHAILHTDGQITGILADLASTQIDAIQSVDSVAGMVMSEALDTAAGRVALVGNVDCGLLITGTPDEVYAHARGILGACVGKPGFIFGASNAVVEETPFENYLAMNRAYEDGCRG